MPDVDLLASRLNKKLDRFVCRDPWAACKDVLVTLWNPFNLIYASPSLKLLPLVLQRIEIEKANW